MSDRRKTPKRKTNAKPSAARIIRSIEFPADLFGQLEQLAEAETRTFKEQVIHLLKSGVQRSHK